MRGRKPVVPPLGDVVDMPNVSGRIPECPLHFKGRLRDIWNDVAGVMVAKNIYDVDCLDALAAYCVQMARFLDAEEEIKVKGTITKGARGGDVVAPWVMVSNHAFDRMVRLASELGLTPVSRKRVVRVRGASSAPATRFLKRA